MRIKTGAYTGNGVARAFTGLGFQPKALIIVSQGANSAEIRTDTMPAGVSKPMTTGTALTSGQITSLDADGFTVSTGSRANQSGVDYQWIALGDDGSGDIFTGTYVGTGVAHTENIVGFQADLILTMSAGANTIILRTSTHSGVNSQTLVGATGSTNITAITATGFTISTNANSNASGTTYHVLALKAHAGQFGVFQYLGNGPVDDYNVDGILQFQPDVVVSKALSAAVPAVMRTKHHVGDLSVPMSSVVAAANWIQAFRPTGMQVGTATEVNGSTGAIYNGFAFKETSARSAVTAARTLRWNVRGALTAQRLLRWNARAGVNASRTLRWQLRGTVTMARTLRWQVRSSISVARSLVWEVLATLPRMPVSATRTLEWTVRAAVEQHRQVRWQLRQTVTRAATLRWQTRIAVSASRQLSWSARVGVWGSRLLTWSVRGSVLAARLLRWNSETFPNVPATLVVGHRAQSALVVSHRAQAGLAISHRPTTEFSVTTTAGVEDA